MTGVAILISGFASLRLGISSYHWHIIVYLAWHCSITHMATITLLRTYFYQRQVERLWRVIPMSIFAVFLGIGIISTGQDSTPSAGIPAICAFWRTSMTWTELVTSMATSLVVLIYSFVTRMIKLHKRPSAWMNTRVRKSLGCQYQKRLLIPISRWIGQDLHTTYWKTTLLYRPSLAMYFVVRIVLDMNASMAGDVSRTIFPLCTQF